MIKIQLKQISNLFIVCLVAFTFSTSTKAADNKSSTNTKSQSSTHAKPMNFYLGAGFAFGGNVADSSPVLGSIALNTRGGIEYFKRQADGISFYVAGEFGVDWRGLVSDSANISYFAPTLYVVAKPGLTLNKYKTKIYGIVGLEGVISSNSSDFSFLLFDIGTGGKYGIYKDLIDLFTEIKFGIAMFKGNNVISGAGEANPTFMTANIGVDFKI